MDDTNSERWPKMKISLLHSMMIVRIGMEGLPQRMRKLSPAMVVVVVVMIMLVLSNIILLAQIQGKKNVQVSRKKCLS
jgi:hypothetical protein